MKEEGECREEKQEYEGMWKRGEKGSGKFSNKKRSKMKK